MSLRARQAAQPCEPLFSQRFTGHRRHLPDHGPKSMQLGRLTGKLLERPRHGEHVVRIAGHAWPAEIANAVHDLHGTGTSVSQIAAVEDQVGRSLAQIRQDRFKRGSIAVDVGYDGDAHLIKPGWRTPSWQPERSLHGG